MSATKKTAKKVAKKTRAFISNKMKDGVVEILNTKKDLKKGEEAGSFVYRVVKDEKTQAGIGGGMNISDMNIKDLIHMVDHVLDAITEHGLPREVVIVKLLNK